MTKPQPKARTFSFAVWHKVPSLNRLYRNPIIGSRVKQQWRRYVEMSILAECGLNAQLLTDIDFPIKIEFTRYIGHRGRVMDRANFEASACKIIHDALKRLGFLPDDSDKYIAPGRQAVQIPSPRKDALGRKIEGVLVEITESCICSGMGEGEKH